VINAFRVLIKNRRLHSSAPPPHLPPTHTRDCLRVVKWVLNFLNRGPNYWVCVFVRDRRVFFVLSGALIMQTTLLPTEQVYYCICHTAGRVVAVTLFVIPSANFIWQNHTRPDTSPSIPISPACHSTDSRFHYFASPQWAHYPGSRSNLTPTSVINEVHSVGGGLLFFSRSVQADALRRTDPVKAK